jgi:hypothetical protein
LAGSTISDTSSPRIRKEFSAFPEELAKEVSIPAENEGPDSKDSLRALARSSSS